MDVTSTRALVAVQGPEARARLAEVCSEAAEVSRFTVAGINWRGTEILVAGTGYTGEDGVECSIPRSIAGEFWDALLAAGVTPAGLGARDTLRLEAGLPLYGNELGPGITPLQAGLGWVVRWDKGDFTGRDALERERREGPSRMLRGISVDGRRPPRSGQMVWSNGREVGVVTSGNFSPSLGHGIALAYLESAIEVGAQVEIEARGTTLEGTVVKTPFLKAR